MKWMDRIKALWSSFGRSIDYEPADTEIMQYPEPPKRAPDVQAALDRIANAKADELPQIVTRQVTDWSTGAVTIVHQDGRPLSEIDEAVMARAAELRRQAGG